MDIINNKDVQGLVAKYPRFVSFLKLRIRQDVFTGLPLTILAIIFGIFLFTFLGITEDVITSDPIIKIDNYLAYFLSEHRNIYLTQFFLWVTLGGKGVTAVFIGILMSIYLILKKHITYIFPLLITLTGSGVTVYLTKLLIHRARPGVDIAYYTEKSLSFPSGHAATSVVLYGFLAYFFIYTATTWKIRTNIFFTAFLIIFLIGLSRMYLGVHYFSDVLGGYMVGVLWLLIGITITETLRFKFKNKNN